MARKSTDSYRPDQSPGMNRLVLAAMVAAALVVVAIVIFALSGPSGPEKQDLAQAAESGSPDQPATDQPATLGKSDCENCPSMVTVPIGTFIMGLRQDEIDIDNVPDIHVQTETPAHSIALHDVFALGRTEITRGQFADFVADTGRDITGCIVYDGANWVLDERASWRKPGFPQTDHDPVVCVSYEDAMAYALWLSQRTLEAYRLPTEAEWEYVARDGKPASHPWTTLEEACKFANVAGRSFLEAYPRTMAKLTFPCDSGHTQTAPVARFQPSALGFYDLFGNARERVGGCWTPNHANALRPKTHFGELDCLDSIVKGGGWDDPPSNLRAPRRMRALRIERRSDTGFRVAKDIPIIQEQP